MHKSKLITVLKSFSKDEIKEFDKFLDSPFFGCKKFVLNFYRVLVSYYPGFNEKKIDKKKIFRILYDDKEYNDGLVRRIISDLLTYSEKYLIQKNFQENIIFKNKCFLNELRNRNLESLFKIKSENLLVKLNSYESVNTDYLLESYFVNLEVKEFRTFIRDSKMHESYALSAEAFTVYFIRMIYPYINHLNTFSREIRSKSGIASAFIESLDLKLFENYLEKSDNRYSKFVKMIIYCYKIVNNKEDRESYYKLNDLLNNNPMYFTKDELKNIFINIIKFFSYQNAHYNNCFLKESYALYEKLLVEHYFPTPALTLQLSFCRNYINLCKQLDKADMIDKFLKKYSKNFPTGYENDLLNFCQSVYYFAKNNFTKSLYSASKVSVDKEIFKKDIKILKLKCLYELRYYDSAYTEIDNFKHFISSSGIINDISIKKGKNFIKIYLALLKIIQNEKGPELVQLRNEIQKENFINEKKWILEKINEIG